MAQPVKKRASERRTIERVQTGVRLERRILSVLKALADLHGMTLGDLLEGIVLHAFEGTPPFSEATLDKIRSLKTVFGLDLRPDDSHQLVERTTSARPRAERVEKKGKGAHEK